MTASLAGSVVIDHAFARDALLAVVSESDQKLAQLLADVEQRLVETQDLDPRRRDSEGVGRRVGASPNDLPEVHFILRVLAHLGNQALERLGNACGRLHEFAVWHGLASSSSVGDIPKVGRGEAPCDLAAPGRRAS